MVVLKSLTSKCHIMVHCHLGDVFVEHGSSIR